MNVGTKIKQLREFKGISQHELSDYLEISQSTLSNIETGVTHSVDFEMVDKLCKKFEIGIEYFLSNGQNNHFEKNNGTIAGNNYNYGTINNMPEDILEQVKNLMDENLLQNKKIKRLEEELKKYKG